MIELLEGLIRNGTIFSSDMIQPSVYMSRSPLQIVVNVDGLDASVIVEPVCLISDISVDGYLRVSVSLQGIRYWDESYRKPAEIRKIVPVIERLCKRTREFSDDNRKELFERFKSAVSR